jgi:hypothetical protein
MQKYAADCFEWTHSQYRILTSIILSGPTEAEVDILEWAHSSCKMMESIILNGPTEAAMSIYLNGPIAYAESIVFTRKVIIKRCNYFLRIFTIAMVLYDYHYHK